MASKKVCLLCMKRFDPLVGAQSKGYQTRLLSTSSGLDTFTEENRQGHGDLYSRFLHFSSRFLKLQSSERLLDGIERRDKEENEIIHAFCAKCFALVSATCDLYAELNTVKAHLLWKLASISDLIRTSDKSVSFRLAKNLKKTLSSQLNAGLACMVDLWRKKVAFKCALKVNTNVPRPVIHRGLFPENWKFTEASTKEALTRLIVVFILSSPEVHSPKPEDDTKLVVNKRRPSGKKLHATQSKTCDLSVKDEVDEDDDEEHNYEFENDGPTDTFSNHDGSDSDWSRGAASPALIASGSDNEYMDRAVTAPTTKRWNFRKTRKRVIKEVVENDNEKEAEKEKHKESNVEKVPKRKRLKPANNNKPNAADFISCNKCSKTFQDKRGLSRHLITAHRFKLNYPCVTCGMKFRKMTDLNHHKRKAHNTGYRGCGRAKESKCTMCDEIFPTLKAMRAHCKLKHNIDNDFVPQAINLSCELCKESFETVYILRQHLEGTHENGEEKAFVCFFCYKSFSLEQTHKVHLKIVHPHLYNRFECDNIKCDKRYKSIAELNEHLKTHVNEFNSQETEDENNRNNQIAEDTNKNSENDGGQFSAEVNNIKTELLETKTIDCNSDAKNSTTNTIKYCATCNWGFLDDYNLELHVLSHIPETNGKFTCSGCGAKYKYIRLLRIHFNKVHGKNVTRFKCRECSQEFFSRVVFDLHIQRHNNKNAKKRLDDPDSDNLFPCSICNAKFEIRRNLLGHMQRVHKGEDKYPCSVCGLTFICKEYVYQHMRVHQAPRHECKICHKFFKTTFNLRSHMLTHASNRISEFICAECGMSYKSDSGLQYHVLSKHTPEELLRFSCPHCSKRYHRRNLFTMHVKTCAKIHGVSAESDKTE